MNRRFLLLAVIVLATSASADDSTLDAAIGGGIGGATGAAIGNEVGGRDGAIVGGAVGAAVGAAIATDDEHHVHGNTKEYKNTKTYQKKHDHPGTRFCPPGQAKKGRC